MECMHGGQAPGTLHHVHTFFYAVQSLVFPDLCAVCGPAMRFATITAIAVGAIYFSPGVGFMSRRQNRYKSIVCDEREKVSIEELTSGSRRKEVSANRYRQIVEWEMVEQEKND